MKRIFTLTLLGLIFTALFSACASTSGGHCDAYGSVDHVESLDVASK
jgi:hypothetical protein